MKRLSKTQWAVGLLLVVAIATGFVSLGKEHMTSCSAQPSQKGFDRPGGDIQTIPGVSSDSACSSKCCENEKCESYTYNGDNKNCFLKSGKATPVPSIPNAYTGTVSRTAAPVASTAKAIGISKSEPTPSSGTDTTTIILIVLGVMTAIGLGVWVYRKWSTPTYPVYGARRR